MVITSYVLEAAIRRQDLKFDYAIRTGNVNEMKVLVEKLARLQELALIYEVSCRVNVKFEGDVVQYTLREANDRLILQERTALGLENLLRGLTGEQLLTNEDLVAEHTHAVGLLAALHAAVSEGRANKLDTEALEIECDEAVFN